MAQFQFEWVSPLDLIMNQQSGTLIWKCYIYRYIGINRSFCSVNNVNEGINTIFTRLASALSKLFRGATMGEGETTKNIENWLNN